MIWLPPWLKADGRPSTKSAMFRPPLALPVPLVIRPLKVNWPFDWNVPSPSECGRVQPPPNERLCEPLFQSKSCDSDGVAT